MRAPPMPAQVAIALAWYFVRAGYVGGAFLILLGFDCFLRTQEMLSLVITDISFGTDGSGVVRLAHTKTGRRHAAFEASTILDPALGLLFQVYCRLLPRNTHGQNYIFPPKTHVFYSTFKKGLRWLGLEEFGFQPYSLRRGGATAYFRATRNMEMALDRGRWSSARVARIYLNDGLAREVELRFGVATQGVLRTAVSAFRQWLYSHQYPDTDILFMNVFGGGWLFAFFNICFCFVLRSFFSLRLWAELSFFFLVCRPRSSKEQEVKSFK